MLNFPKTGSSFARQAIKDLLGEKVFINEFFDNLILSLHLKKKPMFKEILPKPVLVPGLYPENSVGQHGTWEQIPLIHQNKPIISILRNPFARYISLYEFGWFKRYPVGKKEDISAKFPNFPELSFADYLDYLEYQIPFRIPGIKLKTDIGNQTIQFVQFFFQGPVKNISID